MTDHSTTDSANRLILTEPPGWVTLRSYETSHNVAFLSGASFALLDMLLRRAEDSVPTTLLANTLALKSAVATSKLEGRFARETDIRDVFHFTPPDPEGVRHWGPDGDVLMFWRNATGVPLGGTDWARNVARFVGADYENAVEDWLMLAWTHANTHGPILAAVHVLSLVLEADDRAERIACLASDALLAKFFGWSNLFPITALHLTKKSLRELTGADAAASVAIQHSITKSSQTTFRLANALATRAAALRAVAPKLRAKGASEAIDIFLSEDAVAPSGMLSPMVQKTTVPMTDRAARRLCDRLVELGVVKELTGRSTFRLYGLVP